MRDLISTTRPADFVVSGFFTPNYLQYAQKFADNLASHDIPFHLYAVGDSEWRKAIRYKPACIERCRADYPAAVIVNMDVDCRVRGPIRSGLAINADVGLRYGGRFFQGRPVFYARTRVSVWNPTPGAKQLCANWRSLCESKTAGNDEALLMLAIAGSEGISIMPFSGLYAGAELNTKWCDPNAIIVHESIHDGNPSWQLSAKHLVRNFRHSLFEAITGRSYSAWKYGD